MSVKQEALLRNWWIAGVTAVGEVFGHPQFTDGHRVHTSQILKVNKRLGIIETLHTFYRLEDYDESEKFAEISELERRISESMPDVSESTRPLRK